MPFQAKFTNEELVSFLTNDSNEVTSSQINEAAAHFGVQVQSVTKRVNKLPQFRKVTRGKWQLTVAEALEKTYQAPSIEPQEERTSLVPEIDENFVK